MSKSSVKRTESDDGLVHPDDELNQVSPEKLPMCLRRAAVDQKNAEAFDKSALEGLPQPFMTAPHFNKQVDEKQKRFEWPVKK